MGNLNQFYMMGRVVAPAVSLDPPPGGAPARMLAIQPGTGPHPPRDAGPPLEFVAAGPQAEIAQALEPGQAVLLRGKLRQEVWGDGPETRLVAYVQAIELLAGGQRRRSTEEG